ncbi:MAG: Co2+/Mg2+ efflux protein ApaG [Acetobacteraceae bacterium]|nr:Co2+/Mg2+ efflux protein ApaG [Acetobacteraceae bacterium]
MSPEYRAVTNGIEVVVRTYFLEDQSDLESGPWVWAYQVRITNLGRETVQLLRRTWRITDAHGRLQIVQGAGVVGEQPVLEAGESFEYTSGTPLDTSSGIMVGAYHMVATASGQAFDVAIPAFSLDSPGQRAQLH